MTPVRILFRSVLAALVALFLPPGLAQAQITVQGVSDRGNYRDTASFRVVTNAGFTYAATLNGVPVPAGVTNTVGVMDYYDLAVYRSDNVSTNVRFIVESSRRLKPGDSTSPELGLLEWIPLPPIPSTAAEMAGASLRVMTPQDYPAGLEIPVVARVEDDAGRARRVNGWVNAAGFEGSAFRILRGVGHGFLPPASPGMISYDAQLQSLATNKQINIEAATTWTTVSGTLGNTTWLVNSRIHVTANLTIPAGTTLTIEAGTVVRVNPGVNITNSGSTIINGTTTQPVVFTATNRVAPEQRAGAWGGWIMRGGELIANGTIMTGSGAAASLSYSPGSSHRSEQPLLYAHNSVVRMTNCALINLAGQVGNGYRSSIVWDHCLIQRAITCGEYDGGTNIITHSAVIEFPSVDGVYNATIADADYDGFYTINTTNYFAHSLFGFCKDDAIDAGSGGAGSVVVTNCWIESALHEALAWSGEGRRTWTYDTVLMNSGQGLECGWSTGADSPLVHGERILSTANCVGTRYGDNYTGTSGLGLKNGFLTATNSLFLYNYRDVWGQVWDNTWNWRTARMNVRGNWLTAPNTNHPDNSVWNPRADSPTLLAPFISSTPGANVGVGLALWPNQLVTSMLSNGVPVRLSSFTTNQIEVLYTVTTPSGTLTNGSLTFPAGATVAKIQLPPAAVQSLPVARIDLNYAFGGAEITGDASVYLAGVPAAATPSGTTLIPFGSSWKFLDDGSNQGTTWRNPGFNDTGWSNGIAELGYGDNDENTIIRSNRTDLTRIATYYFRKSISIADPAQYGSFTLQLRRDDAGVVYFNGTDVFRSSLLPGGELAYTFVTGGTAPPDNTVDTTNIVNTGAILSNGVNVVACEIHQQSLGSSDVSFDLQLTGVPPLLPPSLFSSRFGDDLVFYWADPTYRLESTTSLPGGWQAVSGAVSPYVTLPAEPQRFYQLRK